MAFKTLSAKDAAELDKDLMSSGAFSLDQLMELAGLSVSQAIYRLHPPATGKRILVACGPGNNGGDGLVAARHLHHYGYVPTIFYPKPTTSNEIYGRLTTQLRNLDILFAENFDDALNKADYVIDAIFGFSFKPPIRDPFTAVISSLSKTTKPVLSVDAPSSWTIDSGPPPAGEIGSDFHPQALISLTAPKPLATYFRGRHFLGGRFLGQSVARKYGIEDVLQRWRDVGMEQIVELPRHSDDRK